MNSFGLNSAAVNGSASRVVPGAAFFSARGTLTADATRTQYGGAVAVATLVPHAAAGVRTAMGEVLFRPEFFASAEWVLATTASAEFYSSFTLRAANTEVLWSATFGFTAEGTIIRPGAATVSAAFVASATPLVTIGYAATWVSTFSLYAEAGVRRSGQTTTERDGYASSASTFTFTAAAVRTAMGFAAAMASFNATADSVKIHAGAATMTSSFVVTAIGSSDGCRAEFTSSFSAQATLTQPGQAIFAASFLCSATPTVTIQGSVAPILSEFSFVADGRLAVQGASGFYSAGMLSADGRLALQGGAIIVGAGRLVPMPWVYRMAEAPAYFTSYMLADGVRICMGEATASFSFSASAEPSTNPAVAAPANRTMHLPREIRSARISTELRTMRTT